MERLLYIFIATILLGLIYMRIEAGLVEIKRIDLAKGKSCLRVLHLSDIHIGLLKVPWNKVRDIIISERPHIIVMTGDYIERESEIPEFISFLEFIKGDLTVYLCLGNHDLKALKGDTVKINRLVRTIEETGARVLNDSSVNIRLHNKKYSITGLKGIHAKPIIEKIPEKSRNDSGTNIVISHNPDILFSIPPDRVDYLFCGHFHGGQIWMPFRLEFRMLRRDRLCRMGISRGLHRINGINLYINRGLGNVIVPLRFLSRPEITVYNLP